MFDPNGGMQNVFLALINILILLAVTVIPIWWFSWEKKYKSAFVAGLFGFIIYCFLLYVANPSLSFWKV